MKKRVFVTLIAPLLLAACGTAGLTYSGHTAPSATSAPVASPTPAQTTTPAPTTSSPSAAPVAAASVFVAQNMHFGAILVNQQGRTLYYFVPERGGQIVCTGACTGAWPPLFASSMAPTSSVALPGQLGAIGRSGGDQVTYSRWPLYTFAGDSGPDQTNGQGIFGFGGKWFVATPSLQP